MRAWLALALLLGPPLALGQSAWPTAHGDAQNHREAASAITPENVDKLQLAWRQRAHAAVTGTPVHDGRVVYFADWDGHVHAVNISSGKVVWETDHHTRIDAALALAGGFVLAGDSEGNLTAFDAKSGAPRWSTWVEPLRGVHLWGSPSVDDGRIYIGIASEQTDVTYEGAQDLRGGVACLDLATGRILWKTYAQPEGAHGVSVWSTPALDPTLGLLYVGSGNAYGEPTGDLSDSLIALRMADGSVAWHFQATAHDGFNARGATGPDADLGASPILYDLDGRQYVADGDKGGRFFALDRTTGKLRWTATADFIAPGVDASQKEGFLATAAYEDGRIFAPTTDRSMVHALDARTGKILWSRELNEKPKTYGDRMFAPTTVTNGVVLQGTAFGELHALDARDGTTLAKLAIGGDVQAGVSVAGDTLLVPDSGRVMWEGQGNVSAYRLRNGTVAPPTPTTPSSPDPATTTTRPTTLSPVIVANGPRASDGAWSRVPAVGAPTAIVLAAVAFATWRRRR